VLIEGEDPQQIAEGSAFVFSGQWSAEPSARRASSHAGDTAILRFLGNQVRVLGDVGPDGGWADAFVDGAKEPTVVECWNPAVRREQPIFLKKGLGNGQHEVKLVVRGEKNPLALGQKIWIEGAQYSAAQGDAGYGEGGGPREAQRLIFGYTQRTDYIDTAGNAWRPGTEFVVRTGFGVDTVARTWWTTRRSMYIGNTKDEEIYRYGVHAPEFCVNLTTGPGDYLVRLHWADTPETAWVEREGDWKPVSRPTTVAINGQTVIENLNVRDVVGTFKAYTREFPAQPRNGTIEVRFTSTPGHEAMIQALEIIPQTKTERKAGPG
jgi:hypothetical protein